MTVIPDDEAVHLVIAVTGLDRDRRYELALVGRPDTGAMVGAGNAQVWIGTRQGETTFTPDRFGELLLWTHHPSAFLAEPSLAHIRVTHADGGYEQVAISLPLQRE